MADAWETASNQINNLAATLKGSGSQTKVGKVLAALHGMSIGKAIMP